ncbi:alkaline shock response membrane anchor protein AmaP [Streptomyces sp. XM4193]|uniref:alkaline shock response membrane anchor protein AmaP n=1 Tax=Streptomyces sp. XM4193 TaxID=2929782 RepID=UPI001FFAA0CD|nr:alkaline shock response membrane anchor protein AmaP [Streptomyces sp. XM4193]MCK1796009.1 alkaline shock response membrane anchor protein AmaP [Streptomyces sp. XM4193]
MSSGRDSARQAFALPPAGERGALVISDRTRNRIAVQAAADAIEQRVVAPVAARPRAVVRLRRGTAHVRLAIALPYPSDIPALCAGVRETVAERCAELTGTPVRRVSVLVDRLEREGDRPGPGSSPGLLPDRVEGSAAAPTGGDESGLRGAPGGGGPAEARVDSAAGKAGSPRDATSAGER